MIQLCAFSDESDKTLKGQIDALHRNEIFLTELRSVEGKNVSTLSLSEAKNICKALKNEGIAIWSVGSPLGKCDITILENEWREQVKSICEIANTLETDKIRAFSFFHAYHESHKVFDFLNLAAEIAKTFGVSLYHENEKEIYGDTVERVTELIQNLRGWKFIYDPANFIQVGERAEQSLPLVKDCSYFHIKDVVASTGEVVPAGEGDGNIAGLLDLIGEDTVLTVEPHLAVFAGYSAIDCTEMKLKHHFESNAQAFDAAVSALKKLLAVRG